MIVQPNQQQINHVNQATPQQAQQRMQHQQVNQQQAQQQMLCSQFAGQPCPSNIPHEVEMYNKIMEFENIAYSPDANGLTTGFKGIDDALENLQSGFHMVGGDSNMGKTAFTSHMAWNVATLNDDAYVMDFSLDDPLKDKMSRMVACGNRVLINAVKNPQRYSHLPDMINRRNQGVNNIINAINRYSCFDSSFSSDIDKIYEKVKTTKIELAAHGIKKKIVVFIDNFHDLDTTHPKAQGSDKNKYDYLAQRISDMAIELDIPVICTGEFRKLNGFRRPSVDDLRESVKIKYEAKSIMLIYNEVSLKGEAAQIHYTMQGEPTKQPIFEVHFGKNKFGGFKGRVYFYFYPAMSFFEQATPEDHKIFNSLLYAS